jgi:hypothetical protein
MLQRGYKNLSIRLCIQRNYCCQAISLPFINILCFYNITIGTQHNFDPFEKSASLEFCINN